MTQLDFARVGIAAQALGIAQAALELSVNYASQRKSFGQPINQFQAVKVTRNVFEDIFSTVFFSCG